MRLKKLQIDKFKNLNTIFDFSNNNGTTVFIGNNGSGKSSVLEVISEIFFHIFNNTLDDVTFKFELEYEINNTDIRIKKNRVVKYEKKDLSRITYTKIDYNQLKEYLPSKLLALYSGEELRLWNKYYENTYKTYMEEIRGTYQIFPPLKLFYVNKYYWDIALLTLLYSPLEVNNNFCKSILKINNLDGIEIEFKFNIDNLTNFNQNTVTAFIEALSQNENAKIFKISEFKEFEFIVNDKELFLKLMASIMDKNSSYKLIDELTITIDKNKNITSKDLSEGEKKQILIKIILEVLRDENSLILFDEPDANIHVANKSLIKDMLSEYDNKEAILTTHSPTLMNIFDDKLVYLENGKNIGKEKAEILREISGDSMSIVEQQIALNSPNDILLVEGKLDILFIQEAIKRLNNYSQLDNLNFIPTGGASGLRLFIDKFIAKDNQKIIAILDYDKAGKDEVKEVLTDTYKNILDRDGFVKINELKNTYLSYLPKPSTVTNSQYEIEDYFPLSKLNEISKKQIDTFKVLKDFKLNKTFVKNELSKDCITEDYNQNDFNEFKLLLDKIMMIKGL